MVRQDNCSFVHLNQAAASISSSNYDKRALSTTDPLALVNSLFNLSYLTSCSTVKIGNLLSSDGGLPLIIHILNKNASTHETHMHQRFTYNAALTCISNIAIRGNQKLRRDLLDCGAIHPVIHLLQLFTAALDKLKSNRNQNLNSEKPPSSSMLSRNNTITLERAASNTENNIANSIIEVNDTESGSIDLMTAMTNTDVAIQANAPINRGDLTDQFINPIFISHVDQTNRLLNNNQINNNQHTVRPTTEFPALVNFNELLDSDDDYDEEAEDYDEEEDQENILDVLFRADDILLMVKLVAYLSKYPDIRTEIHKGYLPYNVFQFIEQLTCPFVVQSLVDIYATPMVLTELRKWSLICMRNCLKKDTESGSFRRCGNLACGNWETNHRQYSKCSRCRRVSYCSKECQKYAWTLHRNWCVKYEGEPLVVGVKQPQETSSSIAPYASL